MKKRIACILMTLIMLVSLVPAAALTASAASLSVSEAAINVLKKMTNFNSTCKQVKNWEGFGYEGAGTQEFRIGYGTVCEEKHNIGADGNPVPAGASVTVHTISQTEADVALREALRGIDEKVNSFASKNGMSFSQSQHDALVLYSFEKGTAWMDGNGALKTAIINGAGTNELLNAWITDSHTNIETNMYVNGVYANVVPSSFVWVEYYPNGGTMAQYTFVGGNYVYYFDSTKTVSHIPVPTKSGYTFLGWYSLQKRNDGNTYYTWEPNLTAECANKALTALWQPAGLTPEKASANSEILYPYYASKLASNVIYDIPDAEDGKEIGKVEADVRLDGDYIGSDGTRWAHIVDTGWVIISGGSSGVPSSSVEIDVTVTVTNSYVNMRKNATIFSGQNGRWNQGDQLRIIDTASADGFLWGQVANSAEDDTPIGWVALMYTNWNTVKDAGNSSTNNSKAIATATITFNGYVNIRSDAGTDNKIVGALARNETVDVYEIKTVNGHQWGRTTAGWFCLTYASVTMLTSGNNIVSDAGAMAYAFTGTTLKELTPYVQASSNTDTVGKLAEGTAVTVTNMVVANDKTTWGKIVWRVDTDDDGEVDANKSGWIEIGDSLLKDASVLERPIRIDAARFQVVSDVKVREGAGNAYASIFTVTPGVEFEAVEIKLVGEDIWGRTSELNANNGWINLSSKYVTRLNAPTIEDYEAAPSTGQVATVINTDSVRVRDYGATYGNVTGSLARGVTVTVWVGPNDKGWYKIDTNQNGEYELDEDGWVYGGYLSIADASSDAAENNGSSGSTTVTTGTGIVANTYAGVNVRSGAGIGNAAVGKLLPGTVVEILETKTVGASKWGRVTQGWVCMDYITMISYSEIPGNSTSDSSKGTAVDSLDKVEKTTTTAVYTGKTTGDISVYASPVGAKDLSKAQRIDYISAGEPVTIYELVTVTETYEETFADGDKANKNGTSTDGEVVPSDDENGDQNVTVVSPNEGGGTTTVTTVISYWARINGGYIYNPEDSLELDGLDEEVHTLTGSDTLNVREQPTINSAAIGQLKKGDQVSVSALKIDNDKVWGRIETGEAAPNDIGWIRLDYMSEGAYYVQQAPAATTPTTPAPTIGSTGNTGTGGFVNNTSGYKYTGKVIRNGATALKVRSTPSTSATETTSLDNGASLVIYETTIADGMAWGRCDAGWVYLYYVDLTPSSGSAIDAKIVYTENAIVYTDSSCSGVAGTYSRMSLVDIYEVVGNMARTDLGWVNVNDIA